MKTTKFVSVDGEGYTRNDGKHIYNLLAASDGSYIHDNDGVSTLDCFQWFMRLKDANPDATFVSFYFSYDVNMILGHLPLEHIDRLKHNGFTYTYLASTDLISYRIEYIARKFFTLYECHREQIGFPWKRKKKIKIWDVFGFFQCSFVKALKDFKIGTPHQMELLTQMKSQRSDFTTEEIDTIIEYNQLECELLDELMSLLNTSLVNAGLQLKSWHGAGAVAQQLMHLHNIEEYIKPVKGNHLNAVLHAYFGGRIQALQIGEIRQPVYSHDLVSAYPNECQYLPSMRHMQFRIKESYDIGLPYTIWWIKWDLPEDTYITPFPFRLPDGRIDYPLSGEGYYWDCEVRAAMQYYSQYITVIRGYQFVVNDQIEPFDFIPELFARRKQFKREGNFAQYAIKLALNSLYGKTAQSQGSHKFQCYLWAGLITAGTRAKMFQLAMQSPQNVIAFATDGLLSTIAHCPNGDGSLGSWETDEFRTLFIIKPGFYTGRPVQSKTIRKVRGFMPREIKFSRLRQEWKRWEVNGIIQIPSTRFIGMKATADYHNWRTWEESTRELSLMPTVGLPELISGDSKHPVYRIIPDRYDTCSRSYDGTMFDEMEYTKNSQEMEIPV